MPDICLPSPWEECRLGDVVDYGAAQKAEPDEISADAWVLELEDIEKDTSKVLQRVTFAQRQSKSTKNRFAVGDVLYGKLRPYLNKVVRADQDGYCSTEIVPLSPSAAVDGGYLFYWLKHPAFLEYVTSVSHGLNMPRLGTEAGKEAPFVLAPINEQKRIADKLDAVLAQVDACRERLDRIPAILKRFRQAVLASATSGRLTEDWRDVAKPSHVTVDAGSGPFDLPTCWAWARIGTLADVKGGKRLPKGAKLVMENTGFPYIKAGQLKHGTVQKEGQEYLLPDVQKSIGRYIVNSGDVYITIVGAYIGDTGVIPPEYDKANLTENAAKICNLNKVRNDYLAFWLRSPVAQDHIDFLVKSGAQGKLALMRIKEIPVPLPSIDEQEEIVRRVEALFAYVDRLEARYGAASAQFERLTPALLVKAFRGELVPQDPNDEPASVLLERIRAARTEQPTVKRGRKPPAVRVPRAPKEKAAMTKSRHDDDVQHKPYLASLLREAGGIASVEDLFRRAELPVTDFYKQLAWEVENGYIRDDETRLEAA
jgi:type I restriction enzyme, S subunit